MRSAPDPEWEVFFRSLRHWYRLLGASSPGARVIELDGVMACVVPAAAERSVFNAVIYRTAEHLGAAVEELERSYDAAGIEAWCVWVPERDGVAAAVLERSGHVLDASPAAMSRGLVGFERPSDGAHLQSWTSGGRLTDVAALNDRSYGYGTDSFARGLPDELPAECRTYVAHRDEAPATCLVTTDHEDNCEIDLVATPPEMRGRGLAGALLGQALADATTRGCRTTTLVATRLGRPVYERLGYRPIGTVDMWERRRTR